VDITDNLGRYGDEHNITQKTHGAQSNDMLKILI